MVIRIREDPDTGIYTGHYTAQGTLYWLSLAPIAQTGGPTQYHVTMVPPLQDHQAYQQAREYIHRALPHHPAHGMRIKWTDDQENATVTVYSDEHPRPLSKPEKLHLYSIEARDERVQAMAADNQRIGREDREIKPIDRKSARKRLAADNY